MGDSVVPACPFRARSRQLDGPSSHRVFGQAAGLGHFLDHMAVAVPAGEIHDDIGGPRVRSQDPLGHAHGLDEFAPVQGSQQTQAANTVADGDLVGRLLLVPGAHQLFNAQA